MIDRIDRTVVKTLQEIAVRTVQAEFQKHGLKVSGAGATFGDAEATLKLKVETLAAPQARDEKARKHFERYCEVYALKPEDYGASFKLRGKAYTLVELHLGRSKYPFIGQTDRGAKYKFTAADVLRGLGRAVPSHLED